MKIRGVWLVCVMLLVAGCGGGGESLDSFRQQWSDAVNHHRAQELYALLDSGSQRRLRHDLEVMRGLPAGQQRGVINQLGGERIKDLTELSPDRYFALLWDLATQGHRPTMAIEAAGSGSAYVVLSLDDQVRQRFRLVVEGGRWVWVLPEQKLGEATLAATRPATEPDK